MEGINEAVKVVKTIYVDSKLKKIYQEFDSYKSLENMETGDVTQDFFDLLFPILWISGSLDMTNKAIGERFGYAESTIEKRMRLLDRVGLIVRNQSSFYDTKRNKWQTTRVITLDPIFCANLSKKLKMEPKSSVKIENEIITDNVIIEEDDIFYNDASEDVSYKKNSFTFSSGRRRGNRR